MTEVLIADKVNGHPKSRSHGRDGFAVHAPCIGRPWPSRTIYRQISATTRFRAAVNDRITVKVRVVTSP